MTGYKALNLEVLEPSPDKRDCYHSYWTLDKIEAKKDRD
jgi:hypothetical protein